MTPIALLEVMVADDELVVTSSNGLINGDRVLTAR